MGTAGPNFPPVLPREINKTANMETKLAQIRNTDHLTVFFAEYHPGFRPRRLRLISKLDSGRTVLPTMAARACPFPCAVSCSLLAVMGSMSKIPAAIKAKPPMISKIRPIQPPGE